MKTKVLAIDDSRTIRNLLAATLEEAGFEYVSAVDGREGVDMYDDVAPDVVITDINMPKMDGLQMIAKVREEADFKGTPILMLTTETSPGLKQSGKELGVLCWIVKPHNDRKLLMVIEKIMARKAA